MVVSLSKKSGKGISDRQVSELTALFTVKPGHAEQLRAAVHRMGEATNHLDPQNRQRVGLRELRLALFDDDQRFLWCTSFETDWDPYIEDAVTYIGVDIFVDFLQHLVEYPYPEGSPASVSSAEIKALLQSRQVQATWFHDVFGSKTMAEIIKALNVEQAFQQVLDDPEAAQALQHPAMKPLLEQAAD
jgi:hypothetical protein